MSFFNGDVKTTELNTTSSTTGYGSGFNDGINGSGSFSVETINIGQEIVTTISIDLQGQTFKLSAPFDSEEISIIGDSGSGSGSSNGHFYQVTDAVNGKVYKLELVCAEAPASSAPDNDIAKAIGIYVDTNSLNSLANQDQNTPSANNLKDQNNNHLISAMSNLTAFSKNEGMINSNYNSGLGLSNSYLHLMAKYSDGSTPTYTTREYTAGKLFIKLHGFKDF